MIHAPTLLKDLQRLLKTLEDDLRVRISESETLTATLQGEWNAARDAGRSGETYAAWLETVITQAGVHWLLSCVFVRFIEDNELVPRPWLSGSAGAENNRLALARDRHEAYFRAHPHDSDRDYLLACFREVERLPGMAAVFDERHNPVFRLGISGDAAMALMAFWQKVNPDSGLLMHDFTDPAWNTRFLGDLYQDLSEATRKRYALLQTPEFVEEFILDRTLTPALNEFGYKEVRLIDPTCGSGHFLLGAFQRLLDVWARNEPARNLRDTVQQALNGVHGIDLNPFAVAIARFRLLVAALKASDIQRLSEAPAFQIHLATGDSLLHGRRYAELDLTGEHQAGARHGYAHAYAIEDLDEANAILGRQYHAVVGNPPYITVKDAALNAAYRARYSSCHRQYSLGVPFTQRFFELALSGDGKHPAGYVGLITANSFMKREFGKKLIEENLPRLDLSHVIDTAGAYIPGHGTPTVILFGRDRRPVGDVVRTVMGIKGEPATPADPALGLVWRAIVEQVDVAGSESAFVSVADTPRATFGKHPWSIGGGGAAELKEVISLNRPILDSVVAEIGFGAVTREDDAYIVGEKALRLKGVSRDSMLPLVEGDTVRDWDINSPEIALWPYHTETLEADSVLPSVRFLWPYRTGLSKRTAYGLTQIERGLAWFEYSMFFKNRFRTPLSITFAFVATHNHFVLDRGGKVFNRSAPVIKLPAGASEAEHLGLLGLLNSALGCFWLKQVCHDKGGGGVNEGHRGDDWEFFYEFTGTKLAEFPLTRQYPLDLATTLDRLAQELAASLPQALVTSGIPTRTDLDVARSRAASLRWQMIATQEELDWRCYRLYGLLSETPDSAALHPGYESSNPPEINFSERAFEIVLARRMAAGAEETTWFARHDATPITELPAHWPAEYQRVVEARIALIESDKSIGLIERPEYKRRWATTPWAEQEQAALKGWLLDRLETERYWAGGLAEGAAAVTVGWISDSASTHGRGDGGCAALIHPTELTRPTTGPIGPAEPALTTTHKLADRARGDADFMQVAELYTGRSDFDVSALVAELVAGESVPFLPVLRYSEAGLRKREQWEATWALQREEDAEKTPSPPAPLPPAGEGRRRDIPVPPKYKSADFLKTDFWRLRGGLDVPKERWVSYPGCERGADGSLVVSWAGWDALKQATALAAYYLDMKENEGWDTPRLQPLLAGLQELVPWLQQWHNDYNPEHALRMGDYFASFVTDEARALGLTLDDLRNWRPAATTARRGRRRAA
jgi:hypothetical protein